MPRRTQRVPAELRCELPHCECKALLPLYCGHKFCSACTLGLVSVTHPRFAMLVITCPLCREKCTIGDVTFALLMNEHRPNGTMLMDFIYTNAGLCLVMQSKAKRKHWVRDPNFFFLETPYYLHYLDDVPPDEWDMNLLFDKLSGRSRTRHDAIGLLADMPFASPPFPLMTDEFSGLEFYSEMSCEQASAEENV